MSESARSDPGSGLALAARAAASPRNGAAAPRHVAIIMDGNGRWAEARGLPRQEGHRRGLEALRATVRNAADLGIEILTVYSFSTENWRRPAAEVSFLMGLLRRFVENDLAELHRAGVKVRMIGNRADLAPDLRALVERGEAMTAANDRLTLVVAFNYGARDEILRAARRLAEEARSGRVAPAEIDEAAFGDRLDSAGLPEPDLVIRTSGETRISNFLLWQAAYAEFVFTRTLWPDFDRAALEDAVAAYHGRERRFGDVVARAG